MKYFIYKIIYGNLFYRYYIRDCMLKSFKNADNISREIFYSESPPPEYDSVIELLVSEGMIIANKFGFTITQRGKEQIESGGYLRQLLVKRITFVAIIIASIASIATFAITLYC